MANPQPVDDGEPSFELKGSLFTLTVFRLLRDDAGAIATELAEKRAQAPGFFANTPVVIDLEGLEEGCVPDLAVISGLMRDHGLMPAAVRGGGDALREAAAALGLGVLSAAPATKPRAASAAQEPPAPTTTIIRRPVRSGQQVYARGGDLVVLAPVSAGSELLADGDIHVYGALRGRALAGVRGNTRARIYCQSMGAELVSVAGNYRVMEDIEGNVMGRPAQAYLDEDHLVIEALNLGNS
jgi:septum site-determining protein MinC